MVRFSILWMSNRLPRFAVGLAMSLGLGGCAVMDGAGPPVLWPSDPAAQQCLQWFERLDAVTDAHHVRDGGAARIAGFPFLRTDRLLASFRDDAVRSDAAFQAWGARLRALDAQARAFERAHLPAAALAELGVPDVAGAGARTQRCADTLWAEVVAHPALRTTLAQRAQVPDDYSDWRRALGLYPLTRGPFFAGVERWQQRWSATFAHTPARIDTTAGWQRHVPATASGSPGGAELAALLGAVPRDALGIPTPDAATAQQLLQAHAPVLVIQNRGAHDRLGRLHWGDGPAPQVDASQPVVYQRLAHTRFGEQTLLQLVYSVWFPQRPPQGALDLLAGAVDAVVMRLTLAPDGRVWLFDSIHACGCYHLFVPTPALVPRPAPDARSEWAFVPTTLPAMRVGERLRVVIESGSHMVVGVAPEPAANAAADGTAPAQTYTLSDEDGLRSLPGADGRRRSAFWPHGIMPGTERGERLLFWPMGIESPGAMRQWGRQPTAFVGRRHFDDARLLQERFLLQPSLGAP